MIYTLTLNPAVDYVVLVDDFEMGKINRSSKESVYFGGKGINVSLILNELGVKSVATGFTAGFTGEALERGISCDNIKSDFVRAETGITRINVKIRHGKETDINTCGPCIKDLDVEKLYKKMGTLKDGDILVLSGSVPTDLPGNIYEEIILRLRDKGVKFVVDAQGELLRTTLKYKPFLIKPNEAELGELFGTKIDTVDTAFKYAKRLKEMGAENVLVSLGSMGAVLLDMKGNEHIAEAHKGKVINTVGAGDSMLAGFIAGYLKTKDFRYALDLGVAAGSATAFCEGLAKKEDIFSFKRIDS